MQSSHYLNINDPSRLIAFFKKSKDRLYLVQKDFLLQQPSSKYTNFLLKTSKGRQRIKTYIDCFIEGIQGNESVFIADQTNTGYERAIQGYTLFDISHFISPFRNALRKVIQEYNLEVKETFKLNVEDIFYVHNLVDYSWLRTSLSYLKTRDEIIDRNRKRIESLQFWTAKLVSASSEKVIYETARQSIYDIFKLSCTFCAVKNGNLNTHSQGKSNEIRVPYDIISKIFLKLKESEQHVAIDKNNKILYLHNPQKNHDFFYIGTPIFNRQGILLGILIIYNHESFFSFFKFDLNLLNQFSYFMGVVLGNVQMSSEIEEQRAELRYLTGRLISIQEKERRNTAADIHDTIAQALSAIGYKALYCQKIAQKNPQKLDKELNSLNENINVALHQCRQIIRDLRPPSLYDLGIVYAFRKLIKGFEEKENISIQSTLPPKVSVSIRKGVVLFRILQEALRNISQHAEASQVNIHLSLKKNACICLKVRDNGKGFETQKKSSPDKMGLGLIIMRERAEDVGGVLKVTSSLGHGCNIDVTIPM